MNIKDNTKFKITKKPILLILVTSFFAGMLYAVFLYKGAKMIPYKRNLEYVFNTNFKFISNYFKSNSDNTGTLFLDIKFKEWRKLVNQRNEVWNFTNMVKYYPLQWTDSIDKVEINGKINFNNQINKVKIKLTGMNYDHFGDPKKWSYKVSVKADNTIERQKKFNLLIPPSREYVNEFISHIFLEELDMIPLRFKPVKLVLNGENMGFYIMEEFYEKRLIEYNKYRESAILRLKDSEIVISSKNYVKYKSIIDSFNLKLELFKNSKIGIEELFNLDKMADRIGMSILFGENHSLIDFNQRYYLNPFTLKLEPMGREWHYNSYSNELDVFTNIKTISEMDSIFYKKLFNNISFTNKINRSLDKITSNLFLDKVYNKHLKDINNVKNVFYSEYPFFNTNEQTIRKNAVLLRSRGNWIEAKLKDSKKNKELKQVKKYATIINDSIIIDKSISLFDKLFIPKGYKVIIKPGVEILLKEQGQILSESPFLAIGKENDSIKFISTINENKGILFLNAKKSFFKYVKFKGINNYSDEFRTLPGSISFYESPVSINHSTFDTSFGGDDLLNIVRTEFEILNSELLNSKADALDSDFSAGIIKNTLFNKIGNDAIDISGSKLYINKLRINDVKDKGISAGEDSYVSGENIQIYGSSLAFSSKDLSTVKIKNIKVDDCDVVFTVFQKKPEYGPASISCQNISYDNYEKEYLVQNNNNLNINSKEIKEKIKDVESKLYGAFYGKSSK
jgi:hypothetical protein